MSRFAARSGISTLTLVLSRSDLIVIYIYLHSKCFSYTPVLCSYYIIIRNLITILFSCSSTLARFHPSKRFHLAIASYKGAVSVYDVQSKRNILNLSEAHDAPCRDVSMCSTQPSLLVSVGYDCKINIFDIRRNKAQSSSGRLTYSHPLSTVALSECGTYFCAGNLKGELIAYDMRSTKAPLAVRPVHEGW